jgi:hypothetical protein
MREIWDKTRDTCLERVAHPNPYLRKSLQLCLGEDRYLLVAGCMFVLCFLYVIPSLKEIEQKERGPLWWYFGSIMLMLSCMMLFVFASSVADADYHNGFWRQSLCRCIVNSVGIGFSVSMGTTAFLAFETSSCTFFRYVFLFLIIAGACVVYVKAVIKRQTIQQIEPFWKSSFQLVAMSLTVSAFLCTYYSPRHAVPELIVNWHPLVGGHLLVAAGGLIMWNCPGASVNRDLIWYARTGGGSVVAMKLCMSLGASVDFQDQFLRVHENSTTSPSVFNLCLYLQGNTALMRATSLAVVEYLLEQHADTHRVDIVS